jgi:hypothetical protein
MQAKEGVHRLKVGGSQGGLKKIKKFLLRYCRKSSRLYICTTIPERWVSG